MSDIRSLALSRAYELVEAGKPEEARTVLEPILINDRDNADAWWIYAHAVTDPAEARHALGNVLRINPNYPGAAELMATLEAQFPPELPEAEPAPPSPPEIPDLEPDFVGGESFWGDEEPAAKAETGQRRRSLLPVFIVVGIIALLVLILVLILPGLTGSTTPTATPPQVVVMELTPTFGDLPPLTDEITPILPEETEATLSLLATIGGELPTTPTEEVVPSEVSPEETELFPTATRRQTLQPTAESTEEPVEVTSVAQAATEEVATPVALAVSPEATKEPEAPTAIRTPRPTVAATDTETIEETAELPTKPAQTVVSPTEESDLTPELAATEPASTVESTPGSSDDYAARIAEELQAFSVVDQVLEEVETSLGMALVARVCTFEGPQLRSTLREVMGVLVDQVDLLPETLTAIGVRLVNCDASRTLRIIVVDRESASEYATGILTQTEFEAQWRPE